MHLATLSLERDVVILAVLILFLATLVAMAPLRRLRLPFTVAVLLLGFGCGFAALHLSDPEGHGFFHELITIMERGGNLSPDLILFVFLPVLIFESAFSLEVRQVLKNLLPIAVLAVPVLLLSTGITGGAVMLAGGADYGLTWPAALLFGVLVSATDPVAVVALFKDLGAPKRLGILVEGESLCNDGTAIVVFNILLALVVSPSAGSLGGTVLSGLAQFVLVAGGGLIVGTLLAFSAFALIGRVIANEKVEISISVVLAYAAFVLAEHTLHVSGVMAVVAAGLVAGSYGRTKVSPQVSEFMHSFWEYMAFVMNALIFFLVGLVIALRVDAQLFVHVLPLLGAALLGVITARAVGVFGTVPFLHRFVEHIDRRYQAVMFWGGLRGAVSLALALVVVGDERIAEETRLTVLMLAAGIVLFTLLVNALTMQPLIKRLGLDRPTPLDRFALAYAELERVEGGASILDQLEREGALLPRVLEELGSRQERREVAARQGLSDVRVEVARVPGAGEGVASLVALSVEKREILKRFAQRQLTERATKALLHSADVLLDAVKEGRGLPEERRLPLGSPRVTRLLSLLEPLPVLGHLARSLWSARLGLDVEATRGLYLTTWAVERTLAKLEQGRGLEQEGLQVVQGRYSVWKRAALQRLQQLTAEFPDYACASQRVLAERHLLHVEEESVEHLSESGLLTDKALRSLKEGILRREGELRAQASQSVIELGPMALLARVPCFQNVDEAALGVVAGRLVSRTYAEGAEVVREGEPGSSMYLIARGMVQVSARDDHGRSVPLSTLGPGDFFGELALLTGARRNATVRALTPVNSLELSCDDLNAVLGENPRLDEQVRGSVYPRVVGRALLHSDVLSPLTSEHREELSRGFVARELSAGDTAVEAGQAAQLACLLRGRLRVAGAEELCEGALLGLCALKGLPAPDTVVALEPCLLLCLPEEALTRFHERHPETVALLRE